MESQKRPDSSEFDLSNVPSTELVKELGRRASSMILVFCPKTANQCSYCVLFGAPYGVKGLHLTWAQDIYEGRIKSDQVPTTLDGHHDENT